MGKGAISTEVRQQWWQVIDSPMLSHSKQTKMHDGFFGVRAWCDALVWLNICQWAVQTEKKKPIASCLNMYVFKLFFFFERAQFVTGGMKAN